MPHVLQRLTLVAREMFAIFATASMLLSSPAIAENVRSFQSLFNGSDLSGWDGDPRFWRVEDGAIVGQTTADNTAERNTFLIYREDEFADFELVFEYQVEGYNSGVQYRSREKGKWNVTGYQADFEAASHNSDAGPVDKYSGMFFEEQGRMFLGERGQAVVVRPNPEEPKKPRVQVVGSVGNSEKLAEAINRDGWNEYRIVAKDYAFLHVINDRVMSAGIDLDDSNRRSSGIIAFQLHSGPPMKIMLRNIRIRQLGED